MYPGHSKHGDAGAGWGGVSWGELFAHLVWRFLCGESFLSFKLHFFTKTLEKQDRLHRINNVWVHKDSGKQRTHCPAFVL